MQSCACGRVLPRSGCTRSIVRGSSSRLWPAQVAAGARSRLTLQRHVGRANVPTDAASSSSSDSSSHSNGKATRGNGSLGHEQLSSADEAAPSYVLAGVATSGSYSSDSDAPSTGGSTPASNPLSTAATVLSAMVPLTQTSSSSSSRDVATSATSSSSSTTSVGTAVAEEDTPEGLADVDYPPEPRSSRSRTASSSSRPPSAADADRPGSPGSSGDPFSDWWSNKDDILTLGYAVATGAIVAASVFVFDVTIQYIHDLPDIFAKDLHLGGGRATGLQLGELAIPFRCVMPIGAGFLVAWLQAQGFSPGLKFLTRAIEGVVDDDRNASMPKSYGQVFRKAAASAITLGSGASMGPEAPSVELGANTAAVLAPKHLTKRRQRMLIAAGAAAGVSAAFDAPATGALFAVEFVLKSSRLGLDRLSTSTVFAATSVAAATVGFLRSEGKALGITGAATHLVGRIPYFSIQPNLLIDVLQYSALGVGCAAAAVMLYEGVRVSEVVLRPLPRWASAPLGGALCGIIAIRFPQVQYGYINLEEIFRDSTHLSVGDLSGLLLAKIAATSVCVGGGLVGGLFAPSLFLGALVGDIMGHFVANNWGVADPTTLTVVGAAAVLGAACRAPLTAFALMVEITRDTGLFVPLLAAIGVASLVSEYAEGIFSQKLEQALTGMYLKERLLFWGAGAGAAAAGAAMPLVGGGGPPAPAPGTVLLKEKTVEEVMATKANLYVRHTLPLAQAKTAMVARGSPAAVVVDDNFTPMGLVYLEDVEAELVKRELLSQQDSNFG